MDIDVNEVQHPARRRDVRDAIDGQFAVVPFATSIDALGPERRDQLIDAMAYLLADYTAPIGAATSANECAFLSRSGCPAAGCIEQRGGCEVLTGTTQTRGGCDYRFEDATRNQGCKRVAPGTI
jgi:hypothetical protein